MWIIYGLLSAAFTGGRTVYDKNLISRLELPPTLIGFVTFLIAVIITAPIAFYLEEQTALSNQEFLTAMSANVGFNVIATLLYFYILKKHDASLMTGIQCVEPLFVIGTAFFFVGETINFTGFIGILFIIIGGIILQKSRIKEDFSSALLHSPWILMVVYMCLTSSATAFSKIAVVEGGVFIYLAARYFILSFVFYVLFIILKKKNKTSNYRFRISHIGSGILLTGSVIFEMLALEVAKTAYVETIRRMSMFFTLTFESMFLENKWNKLRIVACFILFIGASLIVLFG